MQRRTLLQAIPATATLGILSQLPTLAAAAAPAKPIRVGVIGHTGRGNYGHGLDVAWLGIPGAEIVAVADAGLSGLTEAQKRLPGATAFADYRRLLSDAKPEFVSICPRFVDEHRDMAVACCEAGVRGIYIEKPFCRTPAEADDIVNACQKHSVKLAVAHRNRFHPVLPVISQLIKDGLLGRLLEIRCRGKEDARGGALDLWVLGSHILNLVHYFGGEPVACSATVLQDRRPITAADYVEGAEGVGTIAGNELHARYELSSGVVAYFDSIAKAGQKEAGFGMQLIGTKGIIDFRMDVEPLAHFLPGSPFNPKNEPKKWLPISTAGVEKPEPDPSLGKRVADHLTALQDLIAAVRENRETMCDAKHGRTIVEMIVAALQSHSQQGARIQWPLVDRRHPWSK